MSEPPWEVAGLPHGLTERHFELAIRAVLLGTRIEVFNPINITVKAAAGEWSALCPLYGTRYEGTAARLTALLATPPLAMADGDAFYPVILVPDPTRPEVGDAAPLGACSAVGYIGSAYCPSTHAWVPRVASRMRHNEWWASVVAIDQERNAHLRLGWQPPDAKMAPPPEG